MVFPPGYCVKGRTTDLDEFREQAIFWGIESHQFGRGRFASHLWGIHTGNLQLSLGWRSTGFMLRGQTPRDCVTLATVSTARAPTHYRGAPLGNHELVALRHAEELEIIIAAPATAFTVSIEETLLERRAAALLGRPLDHWRRHERLRLARGNRPNRLQRALSRYLRLALESGVTATPEGAARLENAIIETLIGGVGAPPIQAARPQRLALARVAEEYLRAHARDPVAIADLCEATGVNERTLFLGFQERYGVSPKAYWKMLRLNGVRRELLHSASLGHGATVSRLAMDWGFFHLGRFSLEYKAMFGELPTETLKRIPRLGGDERLLRAEPDAGDPFPANFQAGR